MENKVLCVITDTGSLEVFSTRETNSEEVMVINIEDIFDNLDISRRVVDGEVQVSTYARITSEELAILVRSVVEYTEQKLNQFMTYKDT